MTPKPRSHAPLAVALALFAAASGCEIVASFNRDLIPTDLDAGVSYDGAYPDGGGEPDVTTVTPLDAGGDSSAPETGSGADAGLDSSRPDSATDANVVDSNVPDTNVPDTNVPDTNVPDTNVPDTSAPADASEDAGDDAAG